MSRQSSKPGDRLTPRQQEVLTFIYGFLLVHGYPPTLREIYKALGLHSTHAVVCHLRPLETKGYIQRDGHRSRGIRVLQPPSAEDRVVVVPIRGTAS